jgi:hypothetical protein
LVHFGPMSPGSVCRGNGRASNRWRRVVGRIVENLPRLRHGDKDLQRVAAGELTQAIDSLRVVNEMFEGQIVVERTEVSSGSVCSRTGLPGRPRRSSSTTTSASVAGPAWGWDGKWTEGFRGIVEGSGVRVVLTPFQAPNAKRLRGAVRALDSRGVSGPPDSLRGTALRVLDEFVAHYHGERNHQGLGNDLIAPGPRSLGGPQARCRERLGVAAVLPPRGLSMDEFSDTTRSRTLERCDANEVASRARRSRGARRHGRARRPRLRFNASDSLRATQASASVHHSWRSDGRGDRPSMRHAPEQIALEIVLSHTSTVPAAGRLPELQPVGYRRPEP